MAGLPTGESRGIVGRTLTFAAHLVALFQGGPMARSGEVQTRALSAPTRVCCSSAPSVYPPSSCNRSIPSHTWARTLTIKAGESRFAPQQYSEMRAITSPCFTPSHTFQPSTYGDNFYPILAAPFTPWMAVARDGHTIGIGFYNQLVFVGCSRWAKTPYTSDKPFWSESRHAPSTPTMQSGIYKQLVNMLGNTSGSHIIITGAGESRLAPQPTTKNGSTAGIKGGMDWRL